MYKSITLQLTTQCSLKCPYCFAPNLSQHMISVNDLKYFYKFCRHTMPDGIHLTGGEPSMHPYFHKIVSHLLDISPVTIYSNLTIPKVWNNISNSELKNLTVLVNLNSKRFYSNSQWKTFNDNLTILSKSKCRLAVSHTFFYDNFDSTFNRIFKFIHTYNIPNLRISQYVDNRKNTIGLNINQVRNLYNYIAKNIDTWKQKGLNIFFDCAVPPCYLEHDVFNKLYSLKVLGTKCCPKAFVLWDLSVTHCYTTLDNNPRRHLKEFTSIEDIIANSTQILNHKLKNKNNSFCLCNACNLKSSFCNCPDYHLLPEKIIEETKRNPIRLNSKNIENLNAHKT